MTGPTLPPGPAGPGDLPRRQFLRLAGGAAAALSAAGSTSLLAACSGGGHRDTLRIGVVAPYTGEDFSTGSVVRNSLQAAVQQINSTGGVVGRKVELLQRDTASDAGAAERVYGELITTPGIIGLLWCGAPGLGRVLSRIGRDEIPTVAVFTDPASAGRLYPASDAPRSLFQQSPPDISVKRVLANYAKSDRGYGSAALLYDKTADTSGDYGRHFRQAFDGVGLDVTAIDTFAAGDADFTAQLSALKESRTEVVYIDGFSNDAATIATSLAAMGAAYVDTPTAKGPDWHPHVFGSFRDINQIWADQASEAAQVGSVTAWHIGGLNFLPGYAVRGWMKKFLGKTPVGGEELPADALYTLLNGLKAAGSTDRRDVVVAIETMGRVSFASTPFGYTNTRHVGLTDDDMVVMTLERLRGPAPTDPPYELGREWAPKGPYANLAAGTTLLVRPTLAANRKAQPEVMFQIMRQGYGTQCTRLPNGSLVNECKIH